MREIRNKEELEKLGLLPVYTFLSKSGVPFFHLIKTNEFIFKHYANEAIQEICESGLWRETVPLKIWHLQKKREAFHFTGNYFGLHYLFFHMVQKDIFILMGGNRSEKGKKMEDLLPPDFSKLVCFLPIEDKSSILTSLTHLKKRCHKIGSHLLDEALFQDICACLERDLVTHYTLDSLAKKFYCHKKKIDRLFHEQAQKPFKEFYTELKMEQAKKCLETTKLTIGEISDKMGYLDESAFSRAFKDYFGFSPHELRQ